MVELSFWYEISGYCHCIVEKKVLESKSHGRICEYKINIVYAVLLNELKLKIEKLRPWKSILKSWNAFCFLMGQDIIVSCNHNLSVNIFKSIILYKRLVVARLFLCPVIASWPQKINHSKNTKKISTRMRNTPKTKILGFCEKNDKSFCARWKLWPLKNIAAALNQFRKVFSKVMKNDDAIFFDLLCCTAQCGQNVFSFKKLYLFFCQILPY